MAITILTLAISSTVLEGKIKNELENTFQSSPFESSIHYNDGALFSATVIYFYKLSFLSGYSIFLGVHDK
jgi:hypothetical protein